MASQDLALIKWEKSVECVSLTGEIVALGVGRRLV